MRAEFGLMSPVSRGRKKRKSRTTSRSQAPLFAVPEACDCPACTGDDLDAEFDEIIGLLVDLPNDLPDDADLLDAQNMAGAFLALCAKSGGGPDDIASALIPAIEATGSEGALNLLFAVAATAEEPAAAAAAAAAGRLVSAGMRPPTWAPEAQETITAECVRFYDADENMSVLIGTMHRAGRSFSVFLSVEHWNCGAAGDLLLLGSEDLEPALKEVRAKARRFKVSLREEALDPAEFRWRAETALDVRQEHDADAAPDLDLGIDPDQPDDIDDEELDEELDFQATAAVVRSLLRQLPESDKPKPRHDRDGGMNALATLLSRGRQFKVPGQQARQPRVDLPPKWKKSAGPAPVYQLKVSLRGAKPPIWRRLQVPSDVTLARVHDIIQIAFDWNGGHLHVFHTPYGDFGLADKELGHQADSSVSLGQVAPGAGERIRYEYDFGDDWDHEVLVEQVLGPGVTNGKARCTGGRRAAPPDDCGGIWGYQELVHILGESSHPEHVDKLHWLGLSDATQFDPDTFDADAVNAVLSRLR